MEDRPRIAITMGDPAGVGPEIIVKMFQDRSVYNFSCPLIVGDATFLNEEILLESFVVFWFERTTSYGSNLNFRAVVSSMVN